MKKQITAAVLAAALFVATPVYATENHSIEESNKITICHLPSETGDHCDRYVFERDVRNEHFNPDGTPKPGHENDRLLDGEVDCHTDEQSKEAKAQHEQEKEGDKEKVVPVATTPVAEKPVEKPAAPAVAPAYTPTPTPTVTPEEEYVVEQHEMIEMK